ncbi:MAG: cupin domain-containing protein [Solirubrobacterales bacterium]|nr:cupin domain-containing protein [Solirubrobacterales bacterium]
MREAVLEDGVPVIGGWFVVSVRDAQWLHNRMRSVCRFGGQGAAHFDDLGISLYWLPPGHAMSLYHHEAGQEDFLVLAGACTLIIEGEERPLARWDLVHCPPRTPHTIVAAGSQPALVFAVGARQEKGSARYPVDPVATAHGAGVLGASSSAQEIYAAFGEPTPGPAPGMFSRAPGSEAPAHRA